MLRSRLLLSLALLLSVAACAREPTPPAATNAAPPAAAEPADPAPAGQTSPDASAPAEAQAQASQESGDGGNGDSAGDARLERLTQLAPEQQLPGGRWKAGTHYRPLVPAQPTSVEAGKVEVVEVFWYGCGHCYALEPFLQNWEKNKPAYVEYAKVPVMWGPVHKAHARLFYTLQALGRERELTPKAFDQIHQRGNMLAADDPATTRAMQAAFAEANGVPEADFLKAYDSFAVNSNLQRAEQLTLRYRVEGVPLMVVNGKYVTDVAMAGGQSELIALLNDLAAAEKRR